MDRRNILSSGNYDTREELEAEIHRMSAEKMSTAKISRVVGVSHSSVRRLIKGSEYLSRKESVASEAVQRRELNRKLNELWRIP